MLFDLYSEAILIFGIVLAAIVVYGIQFKPIYLFFTDRVIYPLPTKIINIFLVAILDLFATAIEGIVIFLIGFILICLFNLIVTSISSVCYSFRLARLPLTKEECDSLELDTIEKYTEYVRKQIIKFSFDLCDLYRYIPALPFDLENEIVNTATETYQLTSKEARHIQEQFETL